MIKPKQHAIAVAAMAALSPSIAAAQRHGARWPQNFCNFIAKTPVLAKARAAGAATAMLPALLCVWRSSCM